MGEFISKVLHIDGKRIFIGLLVGVLVMVVIQQEMVPIHIRRSSSFPLDTGQGDQGILLHILISQLRICLFLFFLSFFPFFISVFVVRIAKV